MLVKCDHASYWCGEIGCKHARNHQHTRDCDFTCMAPNSDGWVRCMKVKCLPVKENKNE